MDHQGHEGSRRHFVSRISFVILRALGGEGFRKLGHYLIFVRACFINRVFGVFH